MMMEMFYSILIMVIVTQWYRFVKIHQTVHIKYIHFILYKLYPYKF